jgi:SrtB family sortase
MKIRNKKIKIIDFLILIFVFGLFFMCFQIYKDYHDVHTAQKKYNEIKSDCVSDHTDKTTGKHIREINWNKLEKKNENCIAWITIPGTVVDYPIVRTNTYNYYLIHDINNDYSQYGTLFFDCRLYKRTLKSKNLIIYGHNMGHYTDVMFSSLMNYRDIKYAKKHKRIYLYTKDSNEPFVYRIISIREVNKSSDAYRVNFKKKEFFNWKSVLKEKSIFNVQDTDIKDVKQILTLSTCTYDSNRLVLHCAREN